jgi:glycosyltransferase involved in cell wall biosynthesis
VDIKALRFEKEIIIYIPTYNCEKHIVDVISTIPLDLYHLIELLIIDNCSTDGTVSKVVSLIDVNKFIPFKINLIRTTKNVGYSGSQKLAYQLVQDSKNVKKVIMLHGDGQYPSNLLLKLIPFFDSTVAIVNGYRSTNHYQDKDETPFITYSFVKYLSKIENFFTGFRFKEWHSGFVMYSIDLLEKIPLEKLTSTRHIDGEMLIYSGILKEQVISVPIYKRYRLYDRFGGFGLIKYVCFHVPIIILKYIFGYHNKVLSEHFSNEKLNLSDKYKIISHN